MLAFALSPFLTVWQALVIILSLNPRTLHLFSFKLCERGSEYWPIVTICKLEYFIQLYTWFLQNNNKKGKVLENGKGKLVWDFEYKMRQSSSARRPDLTLEDKERKRVWICDMACPQESNIEAKVKEKLDKYQQLAFEMRENRVGHRVEIVPLVIGCLGGGVGKLLKAVQSVLDTETEIENTVKGMQKTVLMDSESIMRKVLSGVVQPQ